jgi:3-dehydroquinate synthase
MAIKMDRDHFGKVVDVELGERSYPIYVCSEKLTNWGQLYADHCGSKRAIIITDTNVEKYYGRKLCESLEGDGVETQSIMIEPGEASKRMEVVETCYDQLFDFNVERRDTIIALGGGVVGDLAGFVAATFKRGLPFVQVPTSLLAMVDSGIGGKTGINHPKGKNMIGAFYQPRLVLCDTATLSTLPPRELSCGLAETVKHAVIRDAAFFDWLIEQREAILALDAEVMGQLVLRNCRIKAAVVSADETESGLRGILNFGHTVGHAFETLLQDWDLHHGEAISRGMVAATRLAIIRNLLSQTDGQRIINLLEAFGLPISFDKPLPVDAIWQTMQHDKKVIYGKINFVLPTAIGNCTFVDDLNESEVKWAINTLVNEE